MLVLNLVPNSSNYNVQSRDGLSIQHDGPRSRMRRGVLNSRIVQVSWALGPNGFQYLRAFFRTGLKEGTEPFVLKAVFEQTIVTLHKAIFVPGTFRISGATGSSFLVEAQVEIERAQQ